MDAIDILTLIIAILIIIYVILGFKSLFYQNDQNIMVNQPSQLQNLNGRVCDKSGNCYQYNVSPVN